MGHRVESKGTWYVDTALHGTCSAAIGEISVIAVTARLDTACTIASRVSIRAGGTSNGDKILIPLSNIQVFIRKCVHVDRLRDVSLFVGDIGGTLRSPLVAFWIKRIATFSV